MRDGEISGGSTKRKLSRRTGVQKQTWEKAVEYPCGKPLTEGKPRWLLPPIFKSWRAAGEGHGHHPGSYYCLVELQNLFRCKGVSAAALGMLFAVSGAPRKRDKKKLAQVGNQPALAFCWLKAAPRADPAFAPRQKAKQPNCWQGGGSKLEASRGWAWRQWGCLAMGLLDPSRAHSSPGWFTSRIKPSPGFSSPNLVYVHHPLDFHRV